MVYHIFKILYLGKICLNFNFINIKLLWEHTLFILKVILIIIIVSINYSEIYWNRINVWLYSVVITIVL